MPFAPNLAGWQVLDETGRRKYVSGEERGRFLATVNGRDSSVFALCRVLMFTGCRVSEALSLTRHMLDVERATLTFKTLKRRRCVFRTVPIPRDLAEALAALPQHDDGRFWTWHRVTAWRYVKEVMQRAQIDGPMACCKGLRHGFGIHAATANVPPNLIQRWMGHASPATTAIYLDAVGIEEREFAKRMW